MKKQKLSEAEEYRDKVFEYLDKLPAGTIAVNKLCKPENYDKFIAVVKSYIDKRGRGYNSFDMDFNENFTKLRKFDLIL